LHHARRCGARNWRRARLFMQDLQATGPTVGEESRPLKLTFRKGFGLVKRPLHRAIERGNVEIVELLLKNFADPNWRDACGRSALDRAVRKKNRAKCKCKGKCNALSDVAVFERCIEALIDAGASEEGRLLIYDVDGSLLPLEPPAHWSLRSEMYLQGRFWLHIEELPRGDIHDYFQQVIDRSMSFSASRQVSTKDRKDGPPPTKLKVERIQRVENMATLRDYLQRRRFISHAISSRTDTALECLKDVKVRVDYQSLAGAGKVSPLDESLNEFFLFHGTSAQGAEGISSEDFSLSLSGSNAGNNFGSGVYFAEDCLKADEYTVEAPTGHAFAGLRPVLLCRICLGRVLVSEDSNVEWEVEQVMKGRCDSLCADRKAAVGTFREFIVFDEDQAYSEYIIWYTRR